MEFCKNEIRCVPLIAYELSIISKIMLLLKKELIDWNTSVCYEWKFVKKVNLTNKNSFKKIVKHFLDKICFPLFLIKISKYPFNLRTNLFAVLINRQSNV